MGKWDTYRFTLDVLGSQATVYPIYEELNLQEEKPENEVFLRPTLDTTFTFIRGDFESINAISIGVEMLLIVEEITAGPTYTEVYRGVFTRTDCNIDEDNKTVKVKPRPRDVYEKVLEALDKEYNLISLAPEVSTVQYKKRPIIQAYVFGGNYVTNFTKGNYWETPVIATDLSVLAMTTKYYFFTASSFFYVPGDSSINPDVSGVYGNPTGIHENGLYEFYYHSPGRVWVIRRRSDGAWVYQGQANEDLFDPVNNFSPAGTLTSNVDGTSKVQVFLITVYLRYLTDKEEISGAPTFEIAEDDIIPNTTNYDRVIGLNANNAFAHSGHSTMPTPYGKYGGAAVNFSGEYFTKKEELTAPYTGNTMPLSRSDWQCFSLWFQYDTFLDGIEADYSTTQETDAYKLSDVISAFLAEIDPTLTHAETTDYSQFFYWNLPNNNNIRSGYFVPMITPKTNVLIGDYDQPAKKAPLRFGEILQFLKDFYGVYWYIRDSKFVLEHIEYFEKGGDYLTDQIAVDITVYKEPKTGKAWGYRSNKYTYDKSAMPERIEFSWMDDQSPVFEGYPLEMLDNYVEKGNIETVSLSKFSADIDYILTSPGEITKDGFVFIEAERNGSVFNIPLASISFEEVTLEVQNGYASLAYAHDQYRRYQMPCTNVKINNTTTTASSIKKTKIQEISIPITPTPESILLITTGQGNGKTEKRTRNLQTKFLNLTLKHDQ